MKKRPFTSMGKVLPEISDKEAAFIAKQKVFFVATAPLSTDHHVSVSPKCQGCVVLDSQTVAYADLTGSGAETAAHVLQNARMTLMFCNIEAGPPKILRLFGKAEIIMADDVSGNLRKLFPESITSSPGFRAVYKLRVSRLSSSCGYSLPVMDFIKYRSTLDECMQKQGIKANFDYQTLNNSFSIDGLPSLALLRKDAPANVVPVPEEGYFFGKPSKTQGPVNAVELGPVNAVEQALLLQKQHASRISLRIVDLILGGALVLVVGIVNPKKARSPANTKEPSVSLARSATQPKVPDFFFRG
jgi:hypothetical protein